MKHPLRIPVDPSVLLDLCLCAAAGFGAGAINGLLGTGGGILLLSVLRRKLRPQNAFAASLACILPLSVLSVVLYLQAGTVTASDLFSAQALPYLLGAIPGGMLGAYLLDRLKLSVTELLFAALLLFSGFRMVFA